MVYVVATNRVWCEDITNNLANVTGQNFILIRNNTELTYEWLKAINPRYVFFPHWSFKIPSDVYENFECVVFHMTDLPFGRGGSPLQNLLSRGIYETKISALRCTEEIDAGPVYMKMPFSLYGSAEEIYIRATKIVEEMIIKIANSEPTPVEQKGEVVHFKRRKPEESNIKDLKGLQQLFDYIRMLDADGYPKAFLETENFRFEFQRASLMCDKVVADAKISRKGGESGK